MSSKILSIVSLFLAVMILIVMVVAFLVYKNSEKFTIKHIENYSRVSFPEVEETILIKGKVWGFAGCHEEIQIINHTIKSSFKVAQTAPLVFQTNEIFYKKHSQDTLLLYVPYYSYNWPLQAVESKVKIVVQPLKTNEEIKKFQINYKNWGLKRVYIYE